MKFLVVLLCLGTSLAIEGEKQGKGARVEIVAPSKRFLGEFSRLAHGLRSGNISLVNNKVFHIPSLYYDGQGPDAFFFVGSGPIPVNGKHLYNGIQIPNEYGSMGVLKKYSGETIALKIPANVNVKNIDWLAVWCVKYTHLFGYVMVPKVKG